MTIWLGQKYLPQLKLPILKKNGEGAWWVQFLATNLSRGSIVTLALPTDLPSWPRSGRWRGWSCSGGPTTAKGTRRDRSWRRTLKKLFLWWTKRIASRLIRIGRNWLRRWKSLSKWFLKTLNFVFAFYTSNLLSVLWLLLLLSLSRHKKESFQRNSNFFQRKKKLQSKVYTWRCYDPIVPTDFSKVDVEGMSLAYFSPFKPFLRLLLLNINKMNVANIQYWTVSYKSKFQNYVFDGQILWYLPNCKSNIST